MCLFTRPVENVSDTNIFARAVGPRQILVYEMAYAALGELAMVLPLPVEPGAGEDALKFIPLDECAGFFAQLREGFPVRRDPRFESMTLGATVELSRTLRVQEVGDFEASFVPTPEDFGRLDERFRLPLDLWLRLNDYRDWGFAVFKLKAAAGGKRVHPMALEFPRRDAKRLFFPTLHIHSGQLEPMAHFDHTLYLQPEPAMNWYLQGWEESYAPAVAFVKCMQGEALFDLARPVWRAKVKGRHENADVWLGPGSRPLPKSRALDIA